MVGLVFYRGLLCFLLFIFFAVLMGREGGDDGQRAVGAAVWFWSFLWFFFLFLFFIFFLTLTIDYGLSVVVVVCNGGGDCGS